MMLWQNPRGAGTVPGPSDWVADSGSGVLRRGLIHRCVFAFAVLLLLTAARSEARAGVIGTMSFDYTLELSFPAPAPSPENPNAIDFLSPRILYASSVPFVVSHTGPFGYGSEGLESGTHPIAYDVPNFPLPTPSSTPVGGFLAYYSFQEFMGESVLEGAFVGLSPQASPSGTFDELFGPHGVTEQQFLSVLKGGDALDVMNMFLAMAESGLMPTWSYDGGSDSWSIEIDIYAFSEPEFAGSITGGVVATPATTVPDESSTLLLAALGLMSFLVAARPVGVSRPPSYC